MNRTRQLLERIFTVLPVLGLLLFTSQAFAQGDTWATKASMPTARDNLTGQAQAIDGKLYVAGGRDQFDTNLGTLEVYDPATDTWTSKASMPTPAQIRWSQPKLTVRQQ